MPLAQAFDPIRSLVRAWKLLLSAPLSVIVGGVLLGFIGGGGWDVAILTLLYGGQLHAFVGGREHLLLLALIACALWAVLFALSSWLEIGYGRGIAHGLRTGEDRIALLVQGGDRFGTMLLARLLSGLALAASLIPMLVALVGFSSLRGPSGQSFVTWLGLLAVSLAWLAGFFYVALGFFLVNPIVALEQRSATGAIARSWQLARANRMQLLWFAVFQWGLTLAGVCACCVGQYLTGPLALTMRFEAYVALEADSEPAQDAWGTSAGSRP